MQETQWHSNDVQTWGTENQRTNSKCSPIMRSCGPSRPFQSSHCTHRRRAAGGAPGPVMERWAWRRPPKRPWMGGDDGGGRQGRGDSSNPSSGKGMRLEQGPKHQSSRDHVTRKRSCLKVRVPQSFRMRTFGCPGMTFPSMLTVLIALGFATLLLVPHPADAVVPLFHEATKMSGLRLPADTATESIVYRLRASDAEKNYPLQFGIRGEIAFKIKAMFL